MGSDDVNTILYASVRVVCGVCYVSVGIHGCECVSETHALVIKAPVGPVVYEWLLNWIGRLVQTIDRLATY
jgi:hypothetical protein